MVDVVPERRYEALMKTQTWDDWDPDKDQYYYDWEDFVSSSESEGRETA